MCGQSVSLSGLGCVYEVMKFDRPRFLLTDSVLIKIQDIFLFVTVWYCSSFPGSVQCATITARQ